MKLLLGKYRNVNEMNVAMMAELGCDPLPNIVFFDPNDTFLCWVRDMVEHGGYGGVVDVGAGCGHLASKLAKMGLRVLAIDNVERESTIFPVQNLDATTMSYAPTMLPIMARPCHNEWIEDTVKKVFADGVKQFIYVGLEKNFADDLGELMGFKKTFFEWEAGEEGEKVVLLERK